MKEGRMEDPEPLVNTVLNIDKLSGMAAARPMQVCKPGEWQW